MKKKYLITGLLLIVAVLFTSCVSGPGNAHEQETQLPAVAPAPADVGEPTEAPGVATAPAVTEPASSIDDNATEHQLFFADLCYMESENMYVRMTSPDGWAVDEGFAQWADLQIAWLPLDAHQSDGSVDITLYMAGLLEETDYPLNFPEFIENDRANYMRRGCNPSYEMIDFDLGNPRREKGVDYGLCRVFGLPNSKEEMFFEAMTPYGQIILFCAAKGNPDDAVVAELEEAFIALCHSLQIYIN